MPVFTIETPGGKRLKIDAPDQATALRGAQEWGAANEKQASRPQASNWDMAAEVADTMTFGLAPKAAAAGIGLIDSTANVIGGGDFNYGENYNRALEKQRAGQAQYRQENPNSSLAAQGIGILGSAGKAPVNAAMKFGDVLKGGVTVGSIAGASQDANSLEERAANTVEGAGMGAGMALAIPPIAKGVGWTWSTVRDFIANRGIDAKAATKVLQELQRTGMTPDQAAQRIKDLGPESMLADVNPGMQALAGGTAVADTGAANTITSRLSARRDNAASRINPVLDQSFGPARDPYAVREGARQAKAAISPQYETALSRSPRLTDQAKGQLRQDVSSLADHMSQGDRRIVLGIRRDIFDAIDHADPEIAARRLLSLRQNLDARIVRDPRAYDNLSSADRAAQRPLQQIRGIIDGVLKGNIPGISQADAAFMPIEQERRMFDTGRKSLQGGPNTMTPGEVGALAQQSPGNANAIAQGQRTEIDRLLSNPRNSPALTVDRVTGRDWNDQKIRNVIGPQRADQVNRMVDRESTFLDTSNLAEVGRNSNTAARTEAARRVWGAGQNAGTTGDVLAATGAGFMLGGPAGAAGAGGTVAARSLIHRFADRLSKPAEGVIQRAAQSLTATGSQRDAVIQELINRAAAIPVAKQSQARIEALVRALLTPQVGHVAN